MAYQTWTRRANAIAAVKKALPTDCVVESVSAALVGVGAWEVTVEIDDTPSAADALQGALGDKARVKALRPEPAPAVEGEDDAPLGQPSPKLGEYAESEIDPRLVAEEELPVLDLSAEFQEMADEADAEHEAAEEADRIAERRASGERAPQMRLKGQRISLIGGKDAFNPYREATKSFHAFEVMRENPKATYEELVKLGAQGRTIRHEIKHGRARAH